jgi:voltage-gated potassium channel Kch
MSKIKVAINGFGRIGRLAFRQIYNMGISNRIVSGFAFSNTPHLRIVSDVPKPASTRISLIMVVGVVFQ